MLNVSSGAAHHETAYILSAMLAGMRRWANNGIPMANVARLEFDNAPVVRRDATGQFTSGLRHRTDEHGHATGGVRYPTIDVPVDLFWAIPSDSFPPAWVRERMPRTWIEERYRSVDRWLILAVSALDRAIESGTVQAWHREQYIDFLRGHVAGR
ncbi:MAG: alpha/beta hydrolase domain-containing protein [Trebonia sp.]